MKINALISCDIQRKFCKKIDFSSPILKIEGILALKLITRHLKDTLLSLFASL